jgi:hypothetical protein
MESRSRTLSQYALPEWILEWSCHVGVEWIVPGLLPIRGPLRLPSQQYGHGTCQISTCALLLASPDSAERGYVGEHDAD